MKKDISRETQLIHSGRYENEHYGAVNMPVYRASTILFENYAKFKTAEADAKQHWTKARRVYGRQGTPSCCALGDMIAELEGAYGCMLTPSGVSAISTALFAFLKAGDHALIVDSVYGPTKLWMKNMGSRNGISYDFYDPRITPENLEKLIKPNTKVLFVESPGSLTFEIQDIPALAEVAHRHNMVVIGDNTWGTPLFFRGLEKGIDVCIQSATKYILGHSDGLMGTIAFNQEHEQAIKSAHYHLGMCLSGDVAYLAMRGLRTLDVRLKKHMESGIEIAKFCQTFDDVVEDVLHPALETSPDYNLWKRDFDGASGLFAFALKPSISENAIADFVDTLKLFGIGYSWGGYESLILPLQLKGTRHSEKLPYEGTLIRLHIGLDKVEELKADLQNGFDALRKAIL
jgi:cystathionine beta-lyase